MNPDDEIRARLQAMTDAPAPSPTVLAFVQTRGRHMRLRRRVTIGFASVALTGSAVAGAASLTSDGHSALQTADLSESTTSTRQDEDPPTTSAVDQPTTTLVGPDTGVTPVEPSEDDSTIGTPDAAAPTATPGAAPEPSASVPSTTGPSPGATNPPPAPNQTPVTIGSSCGNIDVDIVDGRPHLIAVHASPGFLYEAHDEDDRLVIEFHEKPPECVVTITVQDGHLSWTTRDA